MNLRERFHHLLITAATELYQDNRDRMDRPDLIPTPNVIADADLALFFEGLERGLISLERGGKFNTRDRPTPTGHWSLLSRRAQGGWYNAEYLPQLAAYAELVDQLGYPAERVLFELPHRSLQLDLAVLSDQETVVVLGEAKRGASMLDSLAHAVQRRFRAAQPGEESLRRGDEARQLAWRLWWTRAPYLWLVGPGVRQSYRCTYDPLVLEPMSSLPSAAEVGLAHRPATQMSPPKLVEGGRPPKRGTAVRRHRSS